MSRSAVEESLLLPLPAKLQTLLVTALFRVLGRLEPEEAVAFVCLLASALFLTVSFRRTGVLLLAVAVFAIPMLAPSPPVAPMVYGRVAVANPPGFAAPLFRGQLRATTSGSFVDELNRTVILRGVNVGGSAKIPPLGCTHFKANKDFYASTPSFVDRPIPLDRADVHFARIASWGLGFVRLLVTWEALEPAPKKYDDAYVQYIVALVRVAAKYNLTCFIDPHQDVWSRWTGGDGAPKWTLEKVGFKVGPELYSTGAALIHQEVVPRPLQRMTWPTNYARLAAATMFTLFFAGNTYAPKTFIDGVPVQEYLQSHYVGAIAHLAAALEGENNVVGFDTLNEPSHGYVGLRDLRSSLFPAPMGHFMSGFDGMVLGAGFPRRVDVFEFGLVFSENVLVNPKGDTVWSSPSSDIWRAHGVWDTVDGKPHLLKPHYFVLPKGESFQSKFMVPFFNRVSKALPKSMMLFIEPHIDLNGAHPHAPSLESLEPGRQYVFAPHFYDALVLVTKSFRAWIALDVSNQLPVVGPWVAESFARWARALHRSGHSMPVLVGETGIPMDLESKRAYTNGDFSTQVFALDRTLKAFDTAMLSYTLWTYTYDNSNRHGDNWNEEDFSLWSADQVTDKDDLNSGGRALPAIIRPYAARIAGVPLEMTFDVSTRRFFVKVTVDPSLLDTLLFVPVFQYPEGKIITAVGSRCGEGHTLTRTSEQMWSWRHGGRGVQASYCVEWVEITPQWA